VHPFLSVATPLALKAAERLRVLSHTTLVQSHKEDHSLVTNADHESDQILREGLTAAFPDHTVLTEESGLRGSVDAEYVWMIDPLDGTRAYAKGKPGYSVMVGLLRKGKPYLGIVVDPLKSILYEAVAGEGAFVTQNGTRSPARMADRPVIGDMRVLTSTGFPLDLQKVLQPVLSGEWVRPINSVGIKVGYLVDQRADIYINHHYVHYWDTLAPQVILEEAGGAISFLDGKPLSYPLGGSLQHAAPTLATAAGSHTELLQIISPLMRPFWRPAR